MENLQGMGVPARMAGCFWPKPCAVAAAVALTFGLSGCGGGASTKPTRLSAQGSVNVNSGDTVVWYNNITGTTGLTKSGSGTLVLVGSSTYTGGTTINAGILQIGNGGSTGSITGDVTNNALMVFNHSDDTTFDGNISGSGSLKQIGDGKLILTGSNTYTGGTTISGGTLQIGQLGGLIGTVGSITGDVANNGSLVFERNEDLTFNGAVSGNGSLEQAGTGVLILTGAHTYTGGTTISNGTLQIGNGGTTGSIAGNVTNDSYYGSLTFNRSDDWNYGGVISGSGKVVKLGGGMLTMSGENTYAGGTFVKAGRLKIVAGGSVASTISVGGSSEDATLEIDKGVTVPGVTMAEGGRLENAGTIATTISGSSAVQGYVSGSAIVVMNLDGGLIESDYTQSGYNIPAINLGSNSTLINRFGSTIRGYTGVATGGVVNNIGGSIIGTTRDGIKGASAVNNSDGGNIVAELNPDTLLNIGSAILTDAANVSINNVRGSNINGVYRGITLFDGGTVTNDGGSTISGSTAISIISRSSATGVVNNIGSSTIKGGLAGIVLSYGGMITNGPGSIIETTAIASGDCSVTLACSIFVPVYVGVGNYGSNGALRLTNAGAIVGDVQVDSTAINNITLMSGGFIHGDLKIGSNAQSSLTLDGDAGTTQLYSNAVTGTTAFAGVLVKDGGGTWVIDSDDLQDVVDTSVNAGSLQATQSLSGNITVSGSGELDGVPGVAGNLSNVGKVSVHGGDSAVGGNYSQSSTGTLAVSLGSKLDVAGSATLNGGTLEITGADSGYVSNTHTDVLTAAGGVTGTFDQLAKDAGVVFTSSTINYDANSVWLDTTGLDVTTAAAGQGVSYTKASMGSAQRVQGAFELLNDKLAAGGLAGVPEDFVHAAGQFQQAPTLQAAQASLQSLSGELHAASAAMTFRTIDASSRAVSDRFDSLLDKGTGFGMWTQNLNVGGDMVRAGYDGVGFQLNGWLVGSDRRIGDSGVAGYAFGQSRGQQRLDRSFDHDNSRSTEGMMYAGWLNGKWYTQGRVGFGRFDQDVSRQILLGNSMQGVRTQYSGNYDVAYGESGLHLGHGNSRITPFVNVQYARLDRGGFTEQGAGGFGLRSNAQTLDRWQAGLGVRAGRHWDLEGGRSVDFSVRAQWQRTLASHGDVFDASFVGLQQWRPVAGIGLSRYSGLLGVGLDAKLSTRATLKFGYDYEMGQRGNAQMLSTRLNVAF